jgi:predicted DNA-binding transcriptional regulator YafY
LKFWDDHITERVAEPYALKEFRNRWYLIAKDTQVKTFALYRLTGLEITKKHFPYPKDFGVNDMFRHSFGIISSNGSEPQEIILSFSPEQGKYIRTLPLHEHQEAVVDNDEEYRIKLKLCITHDLLMELLSYGEELIIVAPEKP